MGAIGSVFQRYEIKYRLNTAQYHHLREVIDRHTVPDKYGESTVCSLYYDTPDRRLICRSIDRPLYKEKLRVRSYGVVQPSGTVFVELKKKFDHVVYKRRITMNEDRVDAYLAGGCPPSDTQIGREIDYACRLYPGLQPSVFLAYDRQAFFSVDDPHLRITFDRNIRFRETDLSMTAHTDGRLILPEDEWLLEVKTSGALPLWLVRALSAAHIYKTRFSKYGTAYTLRNEGDAIHA